MLERYDEQLILGYVENDLEPEVRLEVESWMAQDDQLRQMLEQMIADRQALRLIPIEKAPSKLMDSVTRALEQQMRLDAPVAASDSACG